jgi:AcrR family transcriptional regulator
LTLYLRGAKISYTFVEQTEGGNAMANGEKMNMRQEQAFETRRKLLESALKLFAENGYAGTQVRAINRDVDLADGIMYHYFPGGKKEILQVLIKENAQQIITDFRSRNEALSHLPIADALEQIYRNADEVIIGHLDAFKVFFKESGGGGIAGKELLESILLNRRRWFPGFLRQRADKGEIREMDFDSAAETLSAIMMNHFLIKLVDLGPGCLSDPKRRRKLIEYQVGLWKSPIPPE